ncbi:MAG: isoleucine--tRNA ligase [Gammaproteobacteria bacterium]
MKAGLPRKEPDILDFWEKTNLYKKIRQKYEGKEFFLLHDGPPYANGDIHLGHSVNKILKDITTKSKTLQGLDSPFIPGWDCHGLPIELNVEKKHGKNSELVKNKESFQKACKEYAETQINKQLDDFKRLGVFGDWENSYKSLDSKFEADIVRSLGIIFREGHLEKGEKPVHWCQESGSSLAEAEVEYIDKTSKAIDVAFKVDNSSLERVKDLFNTENSEEISFVIWTTTPWTIPSNVAVCINPEYKYSVIKMNNKFYVIAFEMIDQCSKRWKQKLDVVSTIQGNKLSDINLIHPFLDRKSILLHADHVTTETGTGCVHTAPAHGMDDYLICKKYNIDTIHSLNNKAFFKDELDFIAGLPAMKADPLIVEKLQEHNALINIEDYHHSYPHCWRRKTPLIFTSTPQWFISMNKNNLNKDALKHIKSINWEPSWGLQRIESMLTDRPDWCISRQRNWGVPITLVVHKDTGEIHPDQKDLFEKFAQIIEKDGISAWDKLNLEDYIDDHEEYIKTSDSLDVWFDSGVTHHAVTAKRFGNNVVADLYLEGSDQHRGWFQSSLLTSIAMNDAAPYKTVLTHGFVVDEQGRKQSKSLGNVVSPQKVWDNLGADILRLWVASTDFRSEMVASDEILKQTSDQYRRIRNTFRFILGNTNDFSNKNKINFEDQVELDKWIVIEGYKLQEQVLNLYNNYSYHKAVQAIHNFCVNELGGIYLDIVKDRLYTSKTDSLARRSCQTSLDTLLNILIRLIAPILSYTAEEIWQSSPNLNNQEESVFLSNYFNNHNKGELKISNEEWKRLFEIKDSVNQSIEELRNENKLKGSLDAVVNIEASDSDFTILEKLGTELHFLFISSDTKITKGSSLKITVINSEHDKCTRCWHRDSSVGKNDLYREICQRCIININEEGEQRSFV